MIDVIGLGFVLIAGIILILLDLKYNYTNKQFLKLAILLITIVILTIIVLYNLGINQTI